MAGDYIPIERNNANATKANQLIRFVELLEQTDTVLRSVVNSMRHMHDGVDYSQVETQFGLQAGDGATVANALAAFRVDWDAIAAPSIEQVIGRLGSGEHTP